MGRVTKRESTVSSPCGPDPLNRGLALTALDLSAAVDVYSDWVDACDAVAKDTANRYEDDPLDARVPGHSMPADSLDRVSETGGRGEED